MKAVDLDYRRSAGFPSLPGYVIGDSNCVYLRSSTLKTCVEASDAETFVDLFGRRSVDR